jgi:hypothetical protein
MVRATSQLRLPGCGLPLKETAKSKARRILMPLKHMKTMSVDEENPSMISHLMIWEGQ